MKAIFEFFTYLNNILYFNFETQILLLLYWTAIWTNFTESNQISKSMWDKLLEWNQWNNFSGWIFQNNNWILFVNATSIDDYEHQTKISKYTLNFNDTPQKKDSLIINEIRSSSEVLQSWTNSLWVYNITLIPDTSVDITINRGKCISEIIEIESVTANNSVRFNNKVQSHSSTIQKLVLILFNLI